MKLINSCIALVALFTAYACAAAVPNSVVAGESMPYTIEEVLADW